MIPHPPENPGDPRPQDCSVPPGIAKRQFDYGCYSGTGQARRYDFPEKNEAKSKRARKTWIHPDDQHIHISLPRQLLTLRENNKIIARYPISSAANGPGEQNGSGCTPRGLHQIRAMIGAGAPFEAVFRARRFTGEIYSPNLGAKYPDRDWILTRIMWLSGLEKGKNRLGSVDTMRRFIYIHGCPDQLPIGVPLSHGCIRMQNGDVLELFGQVWPGICVQIDDDRQCCARRIFQRELKIRIVASASFILIIQDKAALV